MNLIRRQDILSLMFLSLTVPALTLQGDQHDAVRIEQPKVDVVIASAPNRDAANEVEIRTSFRLRNQSGRADDNRRVIPVAAPPMLNYDRPDKPWCRVTVNGKPVEIQAERLVDRNRQSFGFDYEETSPEWPDRIKRWIQQDKQLLELVSRYRTKRESAPDIGEVTREFEKRVKRHLIHGDDLAHTAIYVATHDPYFRHLIDLMPEIDPELRIDGPYHRWQYVSILDGNDWKAFRPYEQEWRERADQWFVSKPDLSELLPSLRESHRSLAESKALLNGPIVKHLHDVNGLSLETTLQMKSFLEGGAKRPTAVLVRTLFADIREQLDAKQQARAKKLSEWGFDESSVSPFTGKLIPTGGRHWGIGVGWRDQSVLEELDRPLQPTRTRRRSRKEFSIPVLVSFDAKLAAEETAMITLNYRDRLSNIGPAFVSLPRFDAHAEFGVVAPTPDPVVVTVTCPMKIQPIITPAPDTITTQSDGARRFACRLDSDARMLHLATVEIVDSPRSWQSHFRYDDLGQVQDLRALIEKIDNPTVGPLLKLALCFALHLEEKPFEAALVADQIAKDHSDFAPILDSIRKSVDALQQAQSLPSSVAAKAKSPSITSATDFQLFAPRRTRNHRRRLPHGALKELARQVKSLDKEKLTLEEQMGRLFILCQAEIETQTNLAELLKLADANPSFAVASLELIERMTIEDKSIALPYLLSRVNQDPQPAIGSALGTFRSPNAAAEIIQFIRDSDDPYLIQEATTSLSYMTLPNHFDQLAEIGDQIASSSQSAFIQYADLVLRSDPGIKKALPLLDSLRQKFPRHQASVTRALSQAGYDELLSKALGTYQSSDDIDGQLRAAIDVICQHAEAADIAKLEYRSGLQKWMNEKLVSLIRRKGGDRSLFPFLQQYYLEHVQGKKLSTNGLPIVDAFAKVGDPRAIPYLHEIFASVESKNGAARAIGKLQLDRAVPRRSVAKPFHETLRKLANPSESDVTRDAAWRILQTDPEAAFERAMQIEPLHSAIWDLKINWTKDQLDQVAFIERFGDVAARQLLEESEGCLLEKRYNIAKLLGIFLPDSRALIEADANDHSIDIDRKLTAQLALKIKSDGSPATTKAR